MARTINPKVEIVDFGPRVELKNGENITPDEFVFGGAKITYKDTGALKEIIEKKKNNEIDSEKIKSGLVKVAGAGHASMATTPGFWAFLEGDSSKMVDSIFTTAKFGSSLMPSSRRVPITEESIMVPKGIVEAGKRAENLYKQVSEKNIQNYYKLQERGVPKQEASKIVQYGHKGGGFMFMPLETLIHFSKLAEKDPNSIPQEGKEIISQFEDFIKQSGARVTYEARKQAPRTGVPHPNIFHKSNNFASELIKNSDKINPTIYQTSDFPTQAREEDIKKYLENREELFKSKTNIKKNWGKALGELEDIVANHNNTISIGTFSNVPWRVWGEIKRHRTMPQTAESIYNAAERASSTIEYDWLEEDNPDFWEKMVSMPNSIKKDKENFDIWTTSFEKSLKAYNLLREWGVKESDAINVIPRGLKLGVQKSYDLYNLTTGYLSLRLCGTAEPEMKRNSEIEAREIEESNHINEDIKKLVSPKCHYVGFCPELSYKQCCGKINKEIKNYNKETHEELQNNRTDNIYKKL